MENQLTVQSLGDAVKDKVRKAMFDAIPDEALVGLIKAEFDKFFVDGRDRYNNRDEASSFKKMVQAEVELAMRARIKDVVTLQVNTITQEWDNDGSKVVGALVEQMAPAAMQGVMKYIAGQCIMSLRNGGVL